MDIINNGLKSSGDKKPLTFSSFEEAEEYFYKHIGQCDSDDSDKEEAKIMEWIEGNDIIVEE